MDNFKYIAERNEWSIDQQVAGYKRLAQRHKQYLIEDKDAMKQWSRDVQKLNDSRYQEDVENLERRSERMRQANKQEIEIVKTSLDFYKKEQNKNYLLPANRREIAKQIYDLTVKYNELRYQNSEKWIDKETSKMEMAGQSQIAILKMEYDAYMRMSKAKDRTAEQSFELQQKIYEKRKALEDEFLSDFQKRINYQKSMEAVSVSDQLNLWTKMQALYKEGSEQRMEIDVQVHDLKKQLLEDQKKVVAEAAKKEKEALEKTRDEEVKRIEAERDAFIEAQDAKIKAIDDLLAKMQTANEDEDYDRAMAEKQARLALLQSAVGPEGIAERKQTEKDIEDMQREHNRTLAKRGLEDQKKKLQDEKTEREKDYNDQIEVS